jgi:uncharacterized protein (DUF2252 family)
MANEVAERILRFNEGRDPERLQRKFDRMRGNPFAFFRATAHLFYGDWPESSPLDHAPAAWISGDLHLENFGSYRGDNGLAYFDINDFDEAALAPPTWEVARFLTSVFVAARTLKLGSADATQLGRTFLAAYTAALIDGKARWIERDCASGMVRKLLRSAGQRTRAELLNARTTGTGSQRRFPIDGEHFLKTSSADRRLVTGLLAAVASGHDDPRFYNVLDVTRRIAGLGSLGVPRFAVLVRGNDGANGQRLLDLKHESPSVLLPRLRTPQPEWKNDAVRVTTVQRRAQAIAPAQLSAVGDNYVLRELQPVQDRLALEHWNGKLKRLRNVMAAMGELSGWAQLRCAGREGAAGADDLAVFARAHDWQDEAMRYARDYCKTVVRDWRSFKAAAG